MKAALKEAKKAYKKGEVPVGCVIVKNGKIIAKGHNKKEGRRDPLAHAEMIAIRKASKRLSSWRLLDTVLYVTLEPCTMCAAAISFARIQNLYFGAIDAKGGAVVSGVKFYDSPTCHHRPEVQGGIMERECGQILKDFFKAKREKVKLLDKKS